jgi:hypothetical protein
MLQIIQSIYDLIGLSENKSTIINDGNLNSNNTSSKTESDTNDETITTTAVVQESAITRTDQIFLKMDADQNGVITEPEFIQGCLQDKFLYQMLTADYSESF